jgi:hypothetical protein
LAPLLGDGTILIVFLGLIGDGLYVFFGRVLLGRLWDPSYGVNSDALSD